MYYVLRKISRSFGNRYNNTLELELEAEFIILWDCADLIYFLIQGFKLL